MIQIVHVKDGQEIEEVKKLFNAYAASLPFDLRFQNFESELADLPGDYAPPAGSLLLARQEGVSVGCVGVRRLEEGICEMKRLYVEPSFRGKGIGRQLATAIIAEGRRLGYRKMKLDTVSFMVEAINLYKSLGFKETKAYTFNPIKEAKYFALELFH